ncbi:MAG: NAD(P)-dependent oxidoreductase [Alphaproteobacteria bacterium]|nr:MAG: NAD(P)-dependent oxidoreductase [Alphaproteobacteria bacterium]|tara:strand:- start:228 stop:1163 length:936 start_codon:yes stop_codon:yes gene_type:complete
MLAKKNILIIGGNGFLGQGILKALNLQTYNVSILDIFLDKKNLKNYKIQHYFKCSTLEKNKMRKALKEEEWDYIIHLAAFGGNGNGLLKAANEDFNKALNINVTGFANLLDNLKSKNTKIIWASSTVVFGEESTYLQESVKETSILNPSTKYGLTKVMAEQVANYYIKNYKMDISAIRFPIIIGPGLNYRGVAAGISDMANAISQPNIKYKLSLPSTPLDVIYIKDASEIVINMIDSKIKLKNIYNCASIRTDALKLLNEFNKFYKNKNLLITENIGTTYPIMNWQRLEKDTNFKIKYSIKKLVKDWLSQI